MTAARLARLRAEARDAGVCVTCWTDDALIEAAAAGRERVSAGPLVPGRDGHLRCVAHADRLDAVGDAVDRRWVRWGLAASRSARQAERRAPRRAAADAGPPSRWRWRCACGAGRPRRTHAGAWPPVCYYCGGQMVAA